MLTNPKGNPLARDILIQLRVKKLAIYGPLKIKEIYFQKC